MLQIRTSISLESSGWSRHAMMVCTTGINTSWRNGDILSLYLAISWFIRGMNSWISCDCKRSCWQTFVELLTYVPYSLSVEVKQPQAHIGEVHHRDILPFGEGTVLFQLEVAGIYLLLLDLLEKLVRAAWCCIQKGKENVPDVHLLIHCNIPVSIPARNTEDNHFPLSSGDW